ncbi:MAG: M23 family metallopeptidase, partial [Myxococcales bacterium]|nr:M23 family metallopeptidase [Myxococcales bacterium]
MSRAGAALRLLLAVCAGVVVVVSASDALAVKHRRPFAPYIGLGYGFDNNFGAAGCLNYACAGSKCYDGHTGSDFPVGLGTEVLAGAPGVVVAVNQGCADYGYFGNPCGGRCGNYVRLQHADGTRTLFCHMKNGSIVVSVNQSVGCGQKLGLSASSGSSTGYHLHFGWTSGSTRDSFSGGCATGGAWVNQGSYSGAPGADCEVQCQCSPGQTQSQGCGRCGTQTRTCGGNCQWGGWSGC